MSAIRAPRQPLSRTALGFACPKAQRAHVSPIPVSVRLASNWVYTESHAWIVYRNHVVVWCDNDVSGSLATLQFPITPLRVSAAAIE